MLSTEEYQRAGFRNRTEYLRFLAHDYGISYNRVRMLSDVLGENEDFDALPVMLDELSMMEISEGPMKRTVANMLKRYERDLKRSK